MTTGPGRWSKGPASSAEFPPTGCRVYNLQLIATVSDRNLVTLVFFNLHPFFGLGLLAGHGVRVWCGKTSGCCAVQLRSGRGAGQHSQWLLYRKEKRDGEPGEGSGQIAPLGRAQ